MSISQVLSHGIGKAAWIKCLAERTEKISSNKQLFDNQILKTKSFMSWNSYPTYVCNAIFRKLKKRKKNANGHLSDSEDGDTPKVWFPVPCIGPIGEKFAKSFISKLRKYSRKNSYYSYV